MLRHASERKMSSVGCVCSVLKRLSLVLFNIRQYFVLPQQSMFNKKVLQAVHIIQGKKPWMVFSFKKRSTSPLST